jgi:hypothetical protein
MIDLTVAADVWGPVLPLVLLALTFLVEVVWRPGQALWKRLTRRRRLAATLQELSCEVQVRVFEEALGEPPTFRDEHDTGAESLFVLDDVYVQIHTDSNQAVTHFAVTTRSDFKPKLRVAGHDVVLGQTTFAEAMRGDAPTGVAAADSNHRWSYAESFYLGNPGYYQTWVVALNSAAPGGATPVGTVVEELGGGVLGAVRFGDFRDGDDETAELPTDWTTRGGVAQFRQTAVVNTLAVAGPHRRPNPNPGPARDRVRVLGGLPVAQPPWWKRVGRRGR